jgi:hypothetical protein
MTVAKDTLNRVPIESLVYVSEGKHTDRPDMRFQPGRLHSLRTSETAGPLEAHAVIISPCREAGEEHQLAHQMHCKRTYNADLIRPGGEIIVGARGKAIIQYSYGRHETLELVALSSKGLVLLNVDPVKNRYEWRFPTDPSTGQDRVPVTAGGQARHGDFTVQDFAIEFDTIAPLEHYTDVLGKVVPFPGYSQVSDDFQGDSELIIDWEVNRRAQC